MILEGKWHLDHVTIATLNKAIGLPDNNDRLWLRMRYVLLRILEKVLSNI